MSITGLVGQKLSSTYLVKRLIAHGAHGVAYEAQHLVTGARCVVKAFHQSVLDLDEGGVAMQRCRRDSSLSSAMRHPAVVRVLDWSRDDALPLVYCVTEFIEGEDVHSRIRRRGRLSAVETLELGLRVALALEAVHKLGVVHRGLTPRNLIYTTSESSQSQPLGGEMVRIRDFGFAHLRPQKISLPLLVPYMAPELTAPPSSQSGSPPANSGSTMPAYPGSASTSSPLYPSSATPALMEPTARVDQYALGAILYEALTGRPPAGPDELALDIGDDTPTLPSLEAQCPEAPLHLVRTIERALSPIHSDRFASISDMIRALESRNPSGISLKAPAPSQTSGAGSGRWQSQASARSNQAAGQASGQSAGPLRPSQLSAANASGGSSPQSPLPPLTSGRSLAPPSSMSLSSSGSQRSRSSQPLKPAPVTPLRRALVAALGLVAAASVVLYIASSGGSREHTLPVSPPPSMGPAGGAAALPAADEPPPPETREQQDLLGQAEQALSQGDYPRAIETARLAIPAQRAFRVLGVAACRSNNARLAVQAMAHLDEAGRQQVDLACQSP